jgi:transposase
MVHVGVDLHKRTSQIAVLTEHGELTRHRLVNDVERVKEFFAELPPKTPVAIEASGTWWWLVDLLESLGHQPVLSHPKQTKAIASARLKNDRVDADRLVLLLRGDLLPTVWIPPAQLREARELIRHRVQLAWVRGEIRNRVVALLARRNLQPTSGKSWFTTCGDRELEHLPLAAIPSRVREDSRALLRILDAQIRRLDSELRQQWENDPRVHRLCTIPGIGPFIAIVLVLEPR